MPTRVALGFLIAGCAAVAKQFSISTSAGAALGTPATAIYATMGSPQGPATDASGNVFKHPVGAPQ